MKWQTNLSIRTRLYFIHYSPYLEWVSHYTTISISGGLFVFAKFVLSKAIVIMITNSTIAR